MDRCKPLAPWLVSGMEGMGYRLVSGSPEGMLLYSPAGPGAPVAASLDPPHAVVGWRSGGVYRVFTPPRSSLPGSYKACILAPGLDRVTGYGLVEDGHLYVEEGEAPLWSLAVPLEHAGWPARLLDVVSQLRPRLVALVRWYGGSRPCSAARLLAGFVPLVDLLPGGGCGWARPPVHPGVDAGF